LVGLAILLQSDRVRLLLGQLVSRHFQRPLYDYRSMWKKFTAGTATCVEQADLSRTLVRLVADVFKTLSVSVWLVDDRKESLLLAASTSLPSSSDPAAGVPSTEGIDVIRYFKEHHEPVDFENVAGRWAEALRAAHPGVFPHGGNRVCVPLIGRGEVLGVILVGDRVGGTPFSVQDFDMLKCVADDAAASVLNVQLSQRLVQGKELEAFQTMAAFFVHDLKNAASTLNLMLKNLPVHFDDPAFRADALRGMEKTVEHINHLISRLGLLRHELRMQLVEADLGTVINEALAGLEIGPGLEVTKELVPLPRTLLDPGQISKVVINLILNAREAMPAQQGRIRIATSRHDDWAVVTVADNGCGMSPGFMARSLFRPFQSTKKSGLGIGMFQSKMIVEAHGGRFKVESELGAGTTFQVFLPLASTSV
jgi:putative PEP-CTERM system histidine kinase